MKHDHPQPSQHPYRGLTRTQQGHILRQCVTLARLLSLEGVAPPLIPQALERLRDDLAAAYRAGIPVLSVAWDIYLQAYRGGAGQQRQAPAAADHKDEDQEEGAPHP